MIVNRRITGHLDHLPHRRIANDTCQQVADALDTLRSANAKMLGCIVNVVGSEQEFERRRYYGYYGSEQATAKG